MIDRRWNRGRKSALTGERRGSGEKSLFLGKPKRPDPRGK